MQQTKQVKDSLVNDGDSAEKLNQEAEKLNSSENVLSESNETKKEPEAITSTE